MKKQNHLHKRFLDKHGYKRLVTKAKEFRDALMGDSGYVKPSINRLALESMLIGWLRSTMEWHAFDAHCAEHYPNTDVYVIAQDQAVQAAQDALFSDDFDGIPWFMTGSELADMIKGQSEQTTRLAAKIARAKKRVGIIDFGTNGIKSRMARKFGIKRKIAEGKAKLGYKPRS